MGGGVCFGSKPLSDLPNPHGNGQPQKRGKRKDDPNLGSGQELPNDEHENDQRLQHRANRATENLR